jgi:hypothetical protein
VRNFMAWCLSCLAIASPAFAETKAPVAVTNRVIPGGRAVLIELPQAEIGTEIELGRVVSDANQYGGGLLGALIISSMDDKRDVLAGMENQKATAHVAPLRQAMRDFDFDGLAVVSTKAALSHIDWFGAQEPKSVKSSSDVDRRALIGAAGTQQLATITYRYGLSPDFTQIRIVADVTLWQPASAHASGTQGALTAIYSQRITAITELRRRSYDPVANVAQWRADGGKLARASIRAGLARMEQLIPFALGQTQAQIDALRAPKAAKVFAAGFYGPPVTAFPVPSGETLIWSLGLIDVAPSPVDTDIAAH